jgi:flagellar L-ring protein FlgH
LIRATPLLAMFLLAGCGNLQRLSEIGRPPAMTAPSDPTKDPSYRPLSLPMPHPNPPPSEGSSLWRAGSRAFFKDQRAAQVGDIVTVLVNVTDNAALSNVTNAGTTGVETFGMPNFFGLESVVPHLINKGIDVKNLINTNSASTITGNGTITRGETVALRLAGVITQVLPNGNFVVAARQEMRVNDELRELTVNGVVRPQDISSDNTISHDRMAEARIDYGGRGQISNYQQSRWGQQLFDAILPF